MRIVASLSAGPRVAPPVTAVTLAPPPMTGQAETARQRSRQHYGIDRVDIEEAIAARHTGRPVPVPTARRRVS